MKRTLIFLLLSILALGAVPAQAVDPAGGVFGTARYVPSNAKGFMALRTDDDFLATLETALNRIQVAVADIAATRTETLTIREILAGVLGAPSVEDITTVLAWSGDTITVAFDRQPGQAAPALMFVIPLADRLTAESYVVGNFGTAVALYGTIGRYTIYESTTQQNFLLFADDVMLNLTNVTAAQMEVIAAENYPLLSDEAGFVEAVSALPAESYSVGIWADGAAFAETQLSPTLDGTYIAAGATLLPDETYTIDVSVVPAAPILPPLTINPDFARFIPDTMGAVVHGADLAALVNTVLTTSEAQTGEPLRGQFTAAFAMVGLDFNEFFSWIKGDFALAGRLDARSALPSLLGTPPNFRGLPDTFDVALLIEAVNAERAHAFSSALAALFRQLSAQGAEGMAVSEESVNSVPITVLTVESALAPGLTLSIELAFGASDDVFVFGTGRAVRSVFNGSPNVTDSATYTAAGQSWLGDPFSVWSLDGLTAANLGMLAYLTLLPTTADTPVPKEEQIRATINRVASLIRYATLSTSVSDVGAVLLRATITLGE